jgi:hypothetical protein
MEYTYRDIIKAKAEGLAHEGAYGTSEQIKASLRDLEGFIRQIRRELNVPSFDADNIWHPRRTCPVCEDAACETKSVRCGRGS